MHDATAGPGAEHGVNPVARRNLGLDGHAPTKLNGPSFGKRRVALVLGSEGEGMRRLTRETCDEIAGLTIKGAVESLNVASAAAVALYELTRRP